MRARGLALAAVVLSGCGKDSPTAPTISGPATTTTTTLPAVLEVRDGITGALLSSSVQTSGSSVTASAAGYLTRQQPAAPTVWLWPQSEAYVLQLVYTSALSGGSISLQRWAPGAVLRIALAPDLAHHQGLLAESVAELARVSRAAVLALQPGDPSANVVIAVGPVPQQFSAQTRTTLAGSTVVSARVTFYAERAVANDPWRNLLLHELGHVLGLGHSADRGDVMWGGSSGRTNERSFADPEVRALTMIHAWRKPGNTYPDVEPAGLGTTTARAEMLWACSGNQR